MKKKIFVLSTLFIAIILIITTSNYYTYTKSINSFVTKTITLIKENYPNIQEEEIIKIINSNIYISDSSSILKEYGFLDNDINYLKTMQESFKNNLITNTIIFLGVLFIVSTFIILRDKKKASEINDIINYLKKLNQGNYNLDIIDNCEGDLSILKNEIYTTTIILREKALKELEDKKTLKDSLSNISHQLKTPLTSILIMVDNLSDDTMDKKVRAEFLQDIKSQIENINFLILSMLKLSRFDANVIKFKKEVINVQKLVLDSLKNIDIIRDLKNITIHTKGSNKVAFEGDYKWELEALTNIIKNCIEHTPEDKNIYVIYEDNSIYTKISIIDEGVGIKKEELHHVFERFYKGENTSNNNFGIGLSLAKEIIEHDNGTIKVDSIINKGTTFTIKYYH